LLLAIRMTGFADLAANPESSNHPPDGYRIPGSPPFRLGDPE